MYNDNIEQQKALYQARRQSFRPPSWLELGKENGLWQTKEELNDFRIALTVYARSTGRGEGWVVVVMNGIATNGMSIYWDEWTNGLQIGTIDRKEWEIAPGKINPSFKSYLEQMKFGDAGNNTAKAAELAAQALLNPLKAAALWQEYQRRLERELAEKGKCDRLGVAYLAPVELVPKVEIGIDRTLETQQLLQIDRPTQIDRLIRVGDIFPALPVPEEYPPLPEELKQKLQAVMGRIGEPEPVVTSLPTKSDRSAIDWLESLTTERILAFKRAHANELYGGGWIEVRELKIDASMLSSVLSKREHVDRVETAQSSSVSELIDSDTIVQEIFANNNLYKRKPIEARAWAEENRDRLSAWFETLPERMRSRHLEINPWLKF